MLIMIFCHKGLVMSNNNLQGQSITLADYVADLSERISPFQRQELMDSFFSVLSASTRSPSIANKTWHTGIWAHISPDKTAPKRGQNRASFKELAANIDYYKRFGVRTFLLQHFFQSIDGNKDEFDYYHPAKQMGGEAAFHYFVEKCRIYDLEVAICLPLLCRTEKTASLIASLAETWRVIAHWQSQGIRGFQLELIELMETEVSPQQMAAIMELHQLLLQALDPSALVILDNCSNQLPSLRHLLQQNYPLSQSILFACLLENFSILAPSYRRAPSSELLYLGNTHRPYDFTQLPSTTNNKPILEGVRKKIFLANGPLGLDGSIGAATVASLFGQNITAYFSYCKFLLGHGGVIVYYQGTELGLGNNYLALNLATLEQLESRITQGEELGKDVEAEVQKIAKNPQYLYASPMELNHFPFFQQYYNVALIHEQTITQTNINQAIAGENPYYQGHCQLAKRRAQSKCLTYGQGTFPLRTMREDIGSFVRRWYDENKEIAEEVAVIKNGSSTATSVNICKSDLTSRESFQLWELEAQRIFPFHRQTSEDFITVNLGPWETLWLKVIATDAAAGATG